MHLMKMLKKKKKRITKDHTPTKLLVVRLSLALAFLLVLFSLSACDMLANWRDNQVQSSHTYAQQGGHVLPPATPITIPQSIARDLPVDPSFTYTLYTDSGGNIFIDAISAWDTLTTTQWMIGKLAQLGYDSGDNASRILEGVDYSGSKNTEYDRIHVKVTLNGSDQCVLEIRGYPKD